MIVTYKPGWSFEWVEHNEGDFLNITVGKPDAKGTDSVTGEERSVSFLLRPPADLDFRVWLHRTIGEIEAHEAAEWLRVDGELLVDEHAEPDDGMTKCEGCGALVLIGALRPEIEGVPLCPECWEEAPRAE